MKRRSTVLVALVLTFFVPLIFAQVSQQQQPTVNPPVYDPEADAISEFRATGVIRAVTYPKNQTITQLRSLLAPARITVEEAALENGARVRSQYIVIIEWDARPGAPEFVEPDVHSLLSGSMTIKEHKRLDGPLQRLPALRLSQKSLFIAAVDAEGKLRWWHILKDPLTNWLESADPATGQMQGKTLQRSRITFMTAYPDDGKECAVSRTELIVN